MGNEQDSHSHPNRPDKTNHKLLDLWRILYHQQLVAAPRVHSCSRGVHLRTTLRWTTSRLLICSLALAPVCLAAKKNQDHTVIVKLPPAPKLKQVQGDERVLHALDRLTFGPRP